MNNEFNSIQGMQNAQKISALAYPAIVTVTENKVLALTDTNKVQKVTAAATITVPPHTSVDFTIGTEISIVSYTADVVAVVAGSGVTINSKDSKLTIDGQYAAATLKKMAADEWVLIGALKA